MSTLLSRLELLQPRSIGTASLAYTDTRPAMLSTARYRPADPQMVETLEPLAWANEWNESGLLVMPHRWSAFTPEGHLAATAGNEPWGSDIGQLGVATDPAQRRRGYAAVAARAAMTAAWDQGLVAKWRCRVGNEASERLAGQLGFRRLGRQAAVILETPTR